MFTFKSLKKINNEFSITFPLLYKKFKVIKNNFKWICPNNCEVLGSL